MSSEAAAVVTFLMIYLNPDQKVERELLKIPTAYLTQYSTIFNEMLTPKLPPGAAARGQCDDNPIILDGVSKLDFERFLTTVFRLCVSLVHQTII